MYKSQPIQKKRVMQVKRFSSEFIEQVRQANDIVSVISDYVTLKRQGRNFWACCPFHNEKTASFSVSEEKGFFYCFGCHAHGDVFRFLMQRENLTFAQAVERLAQRAHIPLPAIELTPEEKAREEMRDRLYKINEMAGNFFHNCLTKTHYGQPGLAYFHKRQVSDDTIEAFKLGFAPDAWSKLTDAFVKKGVSPRDLLTLGLCKEKNGHYYDAFRNRVIFPIRDGRGRIVGFGGRVLDDSKPKYLNSPETPIFNKRRLLFAMDLAHKAIYEAGRAVLVEGYMDVISAHNRGIRNVVASLGTSFTPEQARILQRQAKELVLGYDMDAAGRTATRRAMEMVRGLGMYVRVLSLPQGKDPDEFITTKGPEAFQKEVNASLNVLDYTLTRALAQNKTDTLEGKAAVTAEVLPVAAMVDNQVTLEAFLKKIANALQIDDNAVRSEFNRYVAAHPEVNQNRLVISPSVEKENVTARGSGSMAVAEENILRFLLEKPASCERIREKVAPDLFSDPRRRHIYEIILAMHTHQGMYTVHDIQQQLSPKEAEELARIMVLQDVPLDEKVLLDYVSRFRLADLQRKYQLHSQQAAAYSRTGDPKLKEELEACKKINVEMKQLVLESRKEPVHHGE